MDEGAAADLRLREDDFWEGLSMTEKDEILDYLRSIKDETRSLTQQVGAVDEQVRSLEKEVTSVKVSLSKAVSEDGYCRINWKSYWPMITLMVSGFGLVLGFLVKTDNGLSNKIDSNFNTLNSKIDSNFNALNSKIDSNFNALDSKIDSNFNTLNSKIDTNNEAMKGTVDQNFKFLIEQTKD